MAFRIERAIRGLRELTLSRRPSELIFHEESTLPTIDVTEFLQADALVTETATALGALPNSDYANVTVPAGELWNIKGVLAITDLLDADQAVTVAPHMTVRGVGFVLANPVTIAASTLGHVTALLPRPILLQAGDDVAVRVNEITVGAGGNIVFTTRALFHRLQS